MTASYLYHGRIFQNWPKKTSESNRAYKKITTRKVIDTKLMAHWRVKTVFVFHFHHWVTTKRVRVYSLGLLLKLDNYFIDSKSVIINSIYRRTLLYLGNYEYTDLCSKQWRRIFVHKFAFNLITSYYADNYEMD